MCQSSVTELGWQTDCVTWVPDRYNFSDSRGPGFFNVDYWGSLAG